MTPVIAINPGPETAVRDVLAGFGVAPSPRCRQEPAAGLADGSWNVQAAPALSRKSLSGTSASAAADGGTDRPRWRIFRTTM